MRINTSSGAMLLFLAAFLLASCASTREHTEEERQVLRAVKTVRIQVDGDYRDNPPGTDSLRDDIEHFLVGKVREAGLLIPPGNRAGDATLKVYYVFVTFKPLNASPTSPSSNTRYLLLHVSLEHQSLGTVAQSREYAEPPYRTTFVETDTFVEFERELRAWLYKVRPPRLLEETCTKSLARKGVPVPSRRRLAVIVHVNPEGAVTAANVSKSSGIEALDNIGTEYVKSCRYSPELVDGKPSSQPGRAIFLLNISPD